MTDDIATELAALRRLVEAHERQLHPVDTAGLPLPNRQHKGNGKDGMDGPRWNIGEWEIAALDDPENQDCIYVRHPIDRYSGDVEGISLGEARRLAGALLAAINHCHDELSRRRRSA